MKLDLTEASLWFMIVPKFLKRAKNNLALAQLMTLNQSEKGVDRKGRTYHNRIPNRFSQREKKNARI